MEKYILVIGGCAMYCVFRQRKDGSYAEKADEFVAGGKGANQAVAASLAGQKVKIISRLSEKTEEQENTNFMLKNLENKGVDVSLVELDNSVDNDHSDVLISLDGDNDIHRFSGAINSFTP